MIFVKLKNFYFALTLIGLHKFNLKSRIKVPLLMLFFELFKNIFMKHLTQIKIHLRAKTSYIGMKLCFNLIVFGSISLY